MSEQEIVVTNEGIYRMVRLKTPTHQVLRFIHAITGESMLTIIDRLAKQELARLQPLQKRDIL